MAGAFAGFMAGSIVAKLLMDKSGWDSSIKAVEKDEKTLGATAQKIGGQIGKVGQQMAAAGVMIIGTFGALVKSTANAGDQIAKMSQRTGVATETLSAYKLGAELAGSSLEGIGTGFRRLSSNILDADKGLKASKDTFAALGIEVRDSDGSLKELEPMLLEVADRFSTMEDGAVKAALAQDIFGRAGMELIPFLNQGRAGLEGIRKEAEKYGTIFSKDAAKASEDFNDSLTRLKTAASGLKNEISMQLMPTMTEYIGKVTEATAKARAWAKEHPALSKALTQGALSAGALLTVGGLLLMTVGRLIITFGQLATAIGTTSAAIMISLGAWAAIGAAALVTYKIVSDLTSAKERLAEADYALHEAQTKLGRKLREAADAAGLTRREFVALTEKYEGNTAALAMAIKRGKEGEALQNALAEAGAKNKKVVDAQREALEKQKKATDAFLPSLDALKEKTKELNEELSLTLRIGVAAELAKWEQAWELYARTGKATEAETEQIRAKIIELKAQLSPVAGMDFFARLEEAAKDAGDGILSFSNIIALATKEKPDLTGDLEASLNEIVRKARQAKEGTQEQVSGISDSFAGLFNEIARGFANTFDGIIEGTATFGDLFLGLWNTVKQGILTVIGEILAAELKGIADRLLAKKAAAATEGVIETAGAARTIAVETAKSQAKGVTSVFSKIPFPFNIAAAVAILATISAIFKKIMKFKEGGVFDKPTIAEVGHGTEYLLPEKKLIGIVQSAMLRPGLAWAGAGGGTGGGTGGGAGGGPTININGPLIQTTGVSRRDLQAASSELFGIIRGEGRRGFKAGRR